LFGSACFFDHRLKMPSATCLIDRRMSRFATMMPGWSGANVFGEHAFDFDFGSSAPAPSASILFATQEFDNLQSPVCGVALRIACLSSR